MEDFIAVGIQIKINPNNPKENLQKICDFIIKSVKEYDAELVIFPEAVTTGFNPNLPVIEFYQKLPSDMNRYFEPVKKIVREKKCHCIIPSYEASTKKYIIYNSVFFIDNTGKILKVYRKTHLYPLENINAGGWSTAGTELPVYNTQLGKIGILISVDGDFPEPARVLALKGAELFIRPSAYLKNYEIWELTNKARAFENDMPILAVNAIGNDSSQNHYFGHSMMVFPESDKVALARAGEDIIYSRVRKNFNKKNKYSKIVQNIEQLKNRNLKCYGNYLMNDFLEKNNKKDAEQGDRQKFVQSRFQKTIVHYLNETKKLEDIISFLKELSKSLDLKFQYNKNNNLLKIFGEANIGTGIKNGVLSVGSEFIERYATLIEISNSVFIRFIEYNIIVESARLSALILTNGQVSEAFFVGLKMLGYNEKISLELLSNKEFVNYYTNYYRKSPLFSADEYINFIDKEFRVSYWDFLTNEDIEKIYKLFKEKVSVLLAKKSRKKY